ncbi:MAG: putative Ig domain-containing protein, partial [Bacteroidales bacterium]|nr:putative Ig domain-containing protein [Bacteroidales bacterium]
MMKKLFFFSFLLIFVSHIFSAPIYNYPITLTQPDGTTIDCFASGDEFYNWVHDSEGYTMIRNAQTGWIEYAQVINDQVVTTGRRVGSIDPVTLGVEKWCRISEEQYLQKRDDFMRTMSPSERLAEALTTRFNYRTGVLHNIVIYIRFANETEFTRQKSTVEVLFNGTERGSSLNRYYQDISNNQFSIPSAFFPVNSGSTILSYQDSYPRAYYQPYNATTNPEGYHEDTNEERDREHALLRGAATALKSQIEAAFTADELDYNNDGHVDNICFMIKGDAGAWSSLLWPHRWSLYSGTALYFHGNKRVYDYNFLLEGHLFSASNGRQSVLVHETYHTLGAPDLYRYPSGSFDPVGKWDVMCSNTVPPQSSSAYISNKYGKFVDNLPEITAAGTYTLYPIWDRTQGHNIAYKIASPNSSLEYFVLEYRNKNSEIYESNIPGDGIIIYRVRPSVNGNSNGPPDEVYVFRPGASNNTTAGTIANAFFSSNSGRTVFNDSSNPPCFLSNNSPGGINISNISASGSATMTFTVNYNSYVINAAAEMGGTISPSGIINVTPGENITFTITPDAGYTIGQVLIDGINNLNAVTSGSFTFTNVQSTHSISATFTIPAATIPFTENFETSSSWMFANGTQTNRWVISTAPNAQTVGSTKSLYITNDNATPPTYYYTNTEGSSAATSYVFAYKPIHFETQSSYLLHFQWKANGESYYDLLRCFLVPNSVPIVGGDPYGMTANNNETPSGWIDLSDGILNLTTSFQELSKTFTVNTPDIYNLVFFWKNDYSVGGQPPAAIDNISIIDPSILPPIITTTTLPNTTVASSFNQTLTATGTAPLTWSVESGSLPTGLTLSSVGVISGTPSTAGTFNFTVKVTNAVGNDTKAFA